MRLSRDFFARVYRSIKSCLLLLASALTLFFLFFRSPTLLFLTEFWFFYWYEKRKYSEVKTVWKIRESQEFRREIFIDQVTRDIEFDFAESRLYRFFASAPYADSLSFLDNTREDWSDTAVSIIQEYYRIEGEEPDITYFPSASRNELRIYQAEQALNTFSIRAADLKDRYRGRTGKEAALHTLCYRTNGILKPEEFEVRDRYEFNSHEKVVSYSGDEVSEEIILPSASTKEKKVLEFLNNILQKKNCDHRFFSNNAYIYLGTVEQMNYLMNKLEQSEPLTAPGYICLLDPSD